MASALWRHTTAAAWLCPRFTDLVDSGRYGLKQGGGFVTPAGDQAPLVAYRNTAYARLGQLLKELGPAPDGSEAVDAPIDDRGNQ